MTRSRSRYRTSTSRRASLRAVTSSCTPSRAHASELMGSGGWGAGSHRAPGSTRRLLLHPGRAHVVGHGVDEAVDQLAVGVVGVARRELGLAANDRQPPYLLRG